MKVVYSRPGVSAWNVITVVARLAARLLEADYHEIPIDRARASWRRPLGRLPRRRRGEPVLVIAPEPVDLYAGVDLIGALWGHRDVFGWVVDSWWSDRVPSVARHRGFFDGLFISEWENAHEWERATGAPVHWLPQGSNVLDWGKPFTNRPVGLQRVGRQPPEWSDDDEVAAAAAARGLEYAGRPPFVDDPVAGMESLMGVQARARFALAFSNRVDPHPYTHPTREYLTGRWTDALASGCVVAGVAPATRSVRELLWPGALLELSGVGRDAGLDEIAAADAAWEPQHARNNHLNALRRLDWRWRVQSIAEVMDRRSPTLDLELERLRRRVATLST